MPIVIVYKHRFRTGIAITEEEYQKRWFGWLLYRRFAVHVGFTATWPKTPDGYYMVDEHTRITSEAMEDAVTRYNEEQSCLRAMNFVNPDESNFDNQRANEQISGIIDRIADTFDSDSSSSFDFGGGDFGGGGSGGSYDDSGSSSWDSGSSSSWD